MISASVGPPDTPHASGVGDYIRSSQFEKIFCSCLTAQQDVKEVYSVYLTVSNLVFHLYGCAEWSIFVCAKNNGSKTV